MSALHPELIAAKRNVALASDKLRALQAEALRLSVFVIPCRDRVDALVDIATANGLFDKFRGDDIEHVIGQGSRGIPALARISNDAASNLRADLWNTRRGLAYVRFADIERTPRKKWLVENFLGESELSCKFGPPGSAKSVLAGDLGAHVAAGRLWFGRRVKQGAVLYVAAERVGLVKRRLAAFRLHHNIDNLPLAVISGAIDLRSSHVSACDIIACGRRLEDDTGIKMALIEIDTVARVLAGGDENSSKDIGALVDNLARIQETTGAHVLVLHHVPHDQQRMRGHGALLAACDTTIRIENTGTIRTATIDKTNDGHEGERLAFTLRSIELHRDVDTGETTTAPIVLPVDGEQHAATHVGRAARLPKAASIALRALTEALADFGAEAAAFDHVPPHVRVVTIAQWRQQAYRRGISTSEEERAKQQAFKRASEYLIGAGRVAAWDGQVWLTA
jgi:hypothetical protein